MPGTTTGIPIVVNLFFSELPLIPYTTRMVRVWYCCTYNDTQPLTTFHSEYLIMNVKFLLSTSPLLYAPYAFKVL